MKSLSLQGLLGVLAMNNLRACYAALVVYTKSKTCMKRPWSGPCINNDYPREVGVTTPMYPDWAILRVYPARIQRYTNTEVAIHHTSPWSHKYELDKT